MMPFTEEAAAAGVLDDFTPSRAYFSSFLRQQACEALLEADKTADGRSLLPLLAHEGLLECYPTHEPAALATLLNAFKASPSEAMDGIARYFGTSRAFYFAFTDMYTQTLFFPAVMGIFVYLLQGNYRELSWILIVYMVVLGLWSSMFLEGWKRRSAEYAYTWGVIDYEEIEKRAEPQPNFHGVPRKSPITGQMELYEPESVRYRRYLVTWPITLGCVFGAGVLMWGSFIVEDWCTQLGLENYFSSPFLNDNLHYLPLLFYVAAIPVLNTYYIQLAKELTRWENHRYESSFQQHLVMKLVFFVATNSYLSLFYCMFYARDLERLRVQFGSLMVTTQFSGALLENGPHLWNKFKAWRAARENPVEIPSTDCPRCQKPLTLASLSPQPTLCDYCHTSVEPNGRMYACAGSCDIKICPRCYLGDSDSQGVGEELEPTPELFDEYIEMALQFGYISMFGWCWPLAAFFCLLNNMLEIRTDFFKLIVSRRPRPRDSGGIGIYQGLMEFLSMGAVVANFASLGVYLFYLHEGQLFDPSKISNATLVVLLMVGEHLMIFLKFVVELVIPDVPEWVTESLEKERYEAETLLHRVKLEQEVAEVRDPLVVEVEETPKPLSPIIVVASQPEKKKHWWKRLRKDKDQ